MFTPSTRNFDARHPVRDAQEFNRQIFDEDPIIMDVQKPENLPPDPKLGQHSRRPQFDNQGPANIDLPAG